MTILSLMVTIFPIKQSSLIEFKEPLCSQKWIAKVDIGKSKWMQKASLELHLIPLRDIMSG